MKDDAYLKCINPKCGLEYPILNTSVQCENGHVLDVKYKNKPSEKIKRYIFMKEETPKAVYLMKVEYGDFGNY